MTETEQFLNNLHTCIAYPCTNKRVAGSAFCKKDKAEHDKSKYPEYLREMIKVSKKK